jgi:heme exporter protein B
MSKFLFFLKAEYKLMLREPRALWVMVLFYVLTIFLFSFALQFHPSVFEKAGGAIIWLMGLFALFLTIEKSFAQEFQTGALTYIYLEHRSLLAYVFAKWLAHTSILGGLLIALTPLIALLLAMNQDQVWALSTSFICAFPTLFLLLLFGAALTLGSALSTYLVLLLLLPFIVPILIFAFSILEASQQGYSAIGAYQSLLGLFLFALALLPWFTATALKQALKS